jgi:hypothetical protein
MSSAFEIYDTEVFSNIYSVINKTAVETYYCNETKDSLAQNLETLKASFLEEYGKEYSIEILYVLNCSRWNSVAPAPAPLSLTLSVNGQSRDTRGTFSVYHVLGGQGAQATCGNGVIEGGEQCDGNTFPSNRDTCQEVNPVYTGGTLQCIGCVIDMSSCTTGGGGPVYLTWPGSARTDADCSSAGGVYASVFNTTRSYTLCSFSSGSCPGGWSQAENWHESQATQYTIYAGTWRGPDAVDRPSGAILCSASPNLNTWTYTYGSDVTLNSPFIPWSNAVPTSVYSDAPAGAADTAPKITIFRSSLTDSSVDCSYIPEGSLGIWMFSGTPKGFYCCELISGVRQGFIAEWQFQNRIYPTVVKRGCY